MIMVTGIAVLGVLSGSMASFFRLTPAEERESGDEGADVSSGQTSAELGQPAPAGGSAPDVQETLAVLARELSALRQQLQSLSDRMGEANPRRE